MSEGLNIYQRIHKIMEDVSYVQKEDKKVNNQYKFVSHDAVTAAIRPALLKHGVQAIPSYFDISADGNRTNCSMSMTFVNINQPEDRIVIPCAGFGQGIDPQDKGAGKAMSYAYKYALLKIFALETGDDPEKDNIDYAPPKVTKAPAKPKLIPLSQDTPKNVYDRLLGQFKLKGTKAEIVEFGLVPDVKDALDKLYDDDRDLSNLLAKFVVDKIESLA